MGLRSWTKQTMVETADELAAKLEVRARELRRQLIVGAAVVWLGSAAIAVVASAVLCWCSKLP
jgi:hypothetical protein